MFNQRSGINSVQRVPVQRKTATLNKENQLQAGSLSPQDVRVDSKMVRTKVLGSHQRQNTAVPVPIQGKEPRPRAQTAIKLKVHNTQPHPVTKQVGPLGEAESGGRSRGSQGQVPQELFELSSQEKFHRWECEHQLENMELGEFELLEQAAEELSFSSNSSFVMQVLTALCRSDPTLTR